MDANNWVNVAEIGQRMDALWAQPARSLKRDAFARYYDDFMRKHQRSQALCEEAAKYIPGTVQHNLSLNYPFPLATTKVLGPYIYDVDGNRYIDLLQAGGPTVVGSNLPYVREKVIELLNECGAVTGLFNEYELKLAKLINRHMPHIEMLRMVASGTEACMIAIRLARACTGAKKVIKISDAYHGWSDQLMYEIQLAGTKGSIAVGVPEECYRHTQAVRVNDLNGLRELMQRNRNDGGTACVIVEPLGPESGARPVEFDFNREVRKLCDEFGALLIFDEVVTGFRVGLGGAAALFGVTPDITVFGKALTGGYPASGAVGGRQEIIRHLAKPADGSYRKVMVGGTLSANPMSCVGGYYTLLEAERTQACEKAAAAGDRLSRGLNAIMEKYALPFVIFNLLSIVHIDLTGRLNVTYTENNHEETDCKLRARDQLLNEFSMATLTQNVLTLVGRRLYTSLADTDEIIDQALLAFDEIFSNY